LDLLIDFIDFKSKELFASGHKKTNKTSRGHDTVQAVRGLKKQSFVHFSL